MRGMTARLLTGYGFLLMKGLHHENQYNAFNLADDFMEPLRPLVDLYVAKTIKTIQEDTELTNSLKAALLGLMNADVLSGGQNHSSSYGMERMVQSFVRICQKKGKALMIPELLGIDQHCYE